MELKAKAKPKTIRRPTMKTAIFQECVGSAVSNTSKNQNVSVVSNKRQINKNVRTYADVTKLLKYHEVPTKELVEKYSPPILSRLSKLGDCKKGSKRN